MTDTNSYISLADILYVATAVTLVTQDKLKDKHGNISPETMTSYLMVLDLKLMMSQSLIYSGTHPHDKKNHASKISDHIIKGVV